MNRRLRIKYGLGACMLCMPDPIVGPPDFGSGSGVKHQETACQPQSWSIYIAILVLLVNMVNSQAQMVKLSYGKKRQLIIPNLSMTKIELCAFELGADALLICTGSLELET